MYPRTKLLPFVFRKAMPTIEEKYRDGMLEQAEAMEKVVTFEESQKAAKKASASASASASAYVFFKENINDEFLLMIADIGCDVLKEMKSPGCEWLFLCDESKQLQPK